MFPVYTCFHGRNVFIFWGKFLRVVAEFYQALLKGFLCWPNRFRFSLLASLPAFGVSLLCNGHGKLSQCRRKLVPEEVICSFLLEQEGLHTPAAAL